MWRGPVFAALLALSCKPAVAKDLGTRGELFPIAERDLFEDIQAKFDALHAAGEVDRINQRLRDRALSGAERPPKVEGISKTATPRAFHFDPTITVQNDIKTADGRLIARAGDQLNPLHLTPMSQRLIFFDGDDRGQVEWAQRQITGAKALVQPILVNGPVLDLTRDWKRQVFFDQGGTLIDRFGIRQVPAIVSRDGDQLLVEEVLP